MKLVGGLPNEKILICHGMAAYHICAEQCSSRNVNHQGVRTTNQRSVRVYRRTVTIQKKPPHIKARRAKREIILALKSAPLDYLKSVA